MAAEEKKPKIDLKARLGKPSTGPTIPNRISSVAPAPGSIPPMGPVPGSIPVPGSVPAPAPISVPASVPLAGGGVGGGIMSAPAFAPVKPPDPFGARASAPPQPQTIKIEMDEEVARAQSKNTNKRAAMFGVVALAFGCVIGSAFGMRYSDSKQSDIAIVGAKELIADIEKSQAKVKELSEKIQAATKDLKEKKFPSSFANDLGALSIPFGADKLYGKGIGRFRDSTLKQLFSYTQAVESLNDRKDALKNLFSGQQKAIQDALASATNPKVGWAVFVQKSPAHGPIAILAQIDPANAFPYKDNWPAKFNISTGRDKAETTRYDGGKDLFSTDQKVLSIPIDPDSVASNMPNDILSRMTSELSKTAVILVGRAGGTPDEDDTPGILKNGDTLLNELRKIGGSK